MDDVRIINADCLTALAELPDASVDAVVTDPPYGLEFMGKEWDKLWRERSERDERVGRTQINSLRGHPQAYVAGAKAQEWHNQWATAVLRVLKPGGYMLCFGGTRTYHRLACAVEDAGFEIRDCLMWIYGSGFPKGKGCLKPAYEPILLCRRPGAKVLPLGIDECRVATSDKYSYNADKNGSTFHGQQGDRLRYSAEKAGKSIIESNALGRWPANLVHDGSDEVMDRFAEFGELKGDSQGRKVRLKRRDGFGYSGPAAKDVNTFGFTDTGTAARFFYCAKASRSERGEGNSHPTVKPLALMEWLVKLVAREGETVLDPFLGSGTTAQAAMNTGRKCIGIERHGPYAEIARQRVRETVGKLFAEAV